MALPVYTAGVVTWQPAPARNRLGIPTDPRLPRFGWGAGSGANQGATASLLAALGREDLLLRDASGSSLWPESPGLNRVWLNWRRSSSTTTRAIRCASVTTGPPWRASGAGRRNHSPAPSDPAWMAWRAEVVTALLVRLRAAMAAACPAARVSLSSNPQEFSYRNDRADWSSWLRRGLVDELVVQIYRDNLAALGRELAAPSLVAAAGRVPVRIGLLAGLRSQPKHPAQLRRELELVQARGFGGIDLFFYESARRHFAALP